MHEAKYDQVTSEFTEILQGLNQIMFGKDKVTLQILIAIICNDHILLEDVPGTGKTLLVNTLARMLGLEFKRVQGTPDTLPADITGANIFNQKESKFEFLPGPLFANIVLFDEINRASPKTQSALLEAMAEAQVSVDNKTYELPQPFFVIATQNPIEHLGTYPLPKAQLDRFLIKTEIGYPSVEEEMKIIKQDETAIKNIELPKLSQADILRWQKDYKKVQLDEELLLKILTLAKKTRESGEFSMGISPRANRKLIKALMARAYIHGRKFVTKDDVFDLFTAVMAHRVTAKSNTQVESTLTQYLKEANI